jgi:hypothetical protein
LSDSHHVEAGAIDHERARQVYICAAKMLKVDAAKLDHSVWRYMTDKKSACKKKCGITKNEAPKT